uniref:Uncharacterized protein n=1 Tax=Arundo donax TaxID=35708 RepID=A0A0A8ZAM4_ARUDO
MDIHTYSTSIITTTIIIIIRVSRGEEGGH